MQEKLALSNPSELANEIQEVFGVSESTAWRDIREVRRAWAEQEEELRPFLRADMLERLFVVYARSMKADDYKSSVNALRQICKITGLEERTVRTILGADDGVQHLLEALALTPAQRAARIAELEAKANVEPEGPPYELLMSIARKAAELCVGDIEDPSVDELRGLLRKAGLGVDE